MRVPTFEAAALRAAGLPLGPLARPLPYWQLGSGKLHTDRRCTRLVHRATPIAGAARAPVRTLLRAADVTADALCRNCGDQLPAPAQAHVQVAGALAEVQRRIRVARAAARTWDDVTSLHVATEVAHREVGAAGPVQVALAARAEGILATAATVRARAAATLPPPPELTAGTGPVVAFLEVYHPEQIAYPRSQDTVAAAATILVRDLPRKAAYALLPAAPAWQEYIRHEPAHATDTAEVFTTALAIVELDPRTSSAWWEREQQLRAALNTARTIHLPAAA